MPVSVDWKDQDAGIIEIRFSREWTIAEYEQALRTCAELASAVTYKIALLHVVPPNIKLPPHYLSNIRRFLSRSNGINTHTIMVVTPSLFTRLTVSTVKKLNNSERLIAADDYDEAVKLCYQRAKAHGAPI
ncbi:MAG: hypothetical protein AAF125_15730 [Chloroflexota bacterium]